MALTLLVATDFFFNSSAVCRAPSIPENHDLSRSSSNASSFASVVEENEHEHEAAEEYDTGLVPAHILSLVLTHY